MAKITEIEDDKPDMWIKLTCANSGRRALIDLLLVVAIFEGSDKGTTELLFQDESARTFLVSFDKFVEDYFDYYDETKKRPRTKKSARGQKGNVVPISRTHA